MSKPIKLILKISSTALFVIAIILAVLLVGVRLLGFQVYTVLSGSMEPEYHTGSLLYVREVDPDELKVRDVITFKLGNVTATHRIVELVPDEDDPDTVRFRTKGDANEDVDIPLVDKSDVIGKPVFSIPYLGFVANYIQQPPGVYVAIVVSAVLILFMLLTDTVTDNKKNENISVPEGEASSNDPEGEEPSQISEDTESSGETP